MLHQSTTYNTTPTTNTNTITTAVSPNNNKQFKIADDMLLSPPSPPLRDDSSLCRRYQLHRRHRRSQRHRIISFNWNATTAMYQLLSIFFLCFIFATCNVVGAADNHSNGGDNNGVTPGPDAITTPFGKCFRFSIDVGQFMSVVSEMLNVQAKITSIVGAIAILHRDQMTNVRRFV